MEIALEEIIYPNQSNMGASSSHVQGTYPNTLNIGDESQQNTKRSEVGVLVPAKKTKNICIEDNINGIIKNYISNNDSVIKVLEKFKKDIVSLEKIGKDIKKVSNMYKNAVEEKKQTDNELSNIKKELQDKIDECEKLKKENNIEYKKYELKRIYEEIKIANDQLECIEQLIIKRSKDYRIMLSEDIIQESKKAKLE